MAKVAKKERPAKPPAAIDLDAALAGVAAMTIAELRNLWRQNRGQEPAPPFPKS
jgi:hypothetical protein